MRQAIFVAIVASLATASVTWFISIVGSILAPAIFIPSGAVLAFHSDTCPTFGWEEYTPAYGRFIRGIDKSKDNIDPQGERTPGSLQTGQFASHSHTRPLDIHKYPNVGAAQLWIKPERHYDYAADGSPLTGDTGGEETRPINVALLYCKKT